MANGKTFLALSLVMALAISSCTKKEPAQQASAPSEQNKPAEVQGAASVKDETSQQNIVQIAAGNKDFSTLVAALNAAGYADSIANPGPFTVFAPTNAAFEKLPKGTVENLVKPENKETLRNILEYHVFVGVIRPESFQDGQVLNQANLDNVTINVKGGKATVNGANIIASVPASNGYIHVIDTVLLPPQKK